MEQVKNNYPGILGKLVEMAARGKSQDIDFIMEKLTVDSSLAMTRNIDFALSLVENIEGFDRLLYYLFHGTLIQRNYSSLYFNRLGEWEYVKKAFELGLIDEIQAYSR